MKHLLLPDLSLVMGSKIPRRQHFYKGGIGGGHPDCDNAILNHNGSFQKSQALVWTPNGRAIVRAPTQKDHHVL